MTLTVREWTEADAASFFRVPQANDHKYSRGVLGLRTGSTQYPGAAVLTAEAAWHTGIGLVTFVSAHENAAPRFGLPSPAAAVLARRPETVFAGETDAVLSRCSAWLIGSGTDASSRSEREHTALQQLLAGSVPVVVDAGALDLTLTRPAAPTIITPHRGECAALWQAASLGDAPGLAANARTAERAQAAYTLANALGVTVLLKGSVTLIASPHRAEVLGVGPATPWLATAGTGDVLAGALGALVAAHADEVRAHPECLAPLGATAALLHDRAARRAGAPCTALDVAQALAEAQAPLR